MIRDSFSRFRQTQEYRDLVETLKSNAAANQALRKMSVLSDVKNEVFTYVNLVNAIAGSTGGISAISVFCKLSFAFYHFFML